MSRTSGCFLDGCDVLSAAMEEYNVCIKAFCSDPEEPPDSPARAPRPTAASPAGTRPTSDEVNYSFEGMAGDVTLYYQAWDVDFSTEVEILVNGNSVGYSPTTPNNSWGSTAVDCPARRLRKRLVRECS